MKTQYTPGPWTVKEYGKESSFYIHAEASVYRDAIAQVHDRTTGEGEANAQLIAAAPTLAEALKAMLPIFEAFTQDELSVTTIDEAIALLPDARAALAAAGVMS